MKTPILAVAVAMALGLAGCSSNKPTTAGVDPGEVRPIKDTKLSTDFRHEGIRVTYTLLGNVEKIEAFGYAPVWRGGFEYLAEADAKDKLIRFLRGETVDTRRMTRILARSIERAQDHTRNRFRTVDGIPNFSDQDLEKESTATNDDANTNTNTAIRKASVNNAQTVTSTITVTARGRLSAVKFDRGMIDDDGRTFVAVYSWTPKGQDAARFITDMMDRR